MDRLLLFACLAVTSLAGYGLGRKLLGLDRMSPVPILSSVLEVLGVSLIFLAANVLLGALAAIALRTLTRHFVGLYLFSDAVLLFLSLLQGLALWSWRERAKARG